ncbi:DUF3307 domain-containing protein [Marinomonas foliarum]|uniref:DUF3307 domain-containing protein n=1 Tax=Marinomonas foliarum TaxID=491950 RepID=A0ABX7IPR8_9GAMM|nr:DUF3307 domain-containing protein [Marinomonas foliarum]QRV23949.1 DUF3307 domain-containing protein [Marinomonas foliarum]
MSDFSTLFISFLLIHTLCDFYLQPKHWIEEKKEKKHRSPKLYLHSILHGVALLIPALALKIDWMNIAIIILIVTITHFAIDLWKVSTTKGDAFSRFAIDQILHVIVLITTVFYITDSIAITELLQHDQLPEAIMTTFAYLLILKPTSVAISCILSKYPISGGEKESVNGLVAGGELIGYLERILILTFTLVGSYAAIGFVLAAKSIFRFGELNKSNDRSMAEYVLIGSLVSVVITTLIGVFVTIGLNLDIS